MSSFARKCELATPLEACVCCLELFLGYAWREFCLPKGRPISPVRVEPAVAAILSPFSASRLSRISWIAL